MPVHPLYIVVLSGSTTLRGAGWHVKDLARAAMARGHHFDLCAWQRLVGRVEPAGPVACDGQVVLDEADVVLLRTVPPGSLEQIVFRMDLVQRLEAAGVVVINPPRAVEVAVDKYLALTRMQQAGIPVPPTAACQRAEDAIAAFDRFGGDVVVKPIFGSEGFGMARVCDPALAERVFTTLQRMGSVIYVQQYIEHGGCDARLFVLDGRVVAAMHRSGNDFRTNIAQGGVARAVQPDPRTCDLALRAAAACDVAIGGVDIVTDRNGQPYVLEVNAVPGWRALSRVAEIDIAAQIITYVEHYGQRQ